MNQQQGVISLADIFKSFSRTGTGTAYTVPTADSGDSPPIPPTTALVKSIRLSNQSGGTVATTVTAMDYSNSSLEVEFYKDNLADGSTEEMLTQPITLMQQDAIKLTGAGVKILISLMEIS